MDSRMKETVKSTYINRFGCSLFTAINIWAVAVVRYSAAIVGWNKAELEEI